MPQPNDKQPGQPEAEGQLEDIIVEEVSLVDRAANRRKFLMVKHADGNSVELVPDGKGGMTVRKAVWTTAYVNSLPDSSFLYVEPGGSKDSEGKTTPRTLRHFPVKDVNGAPDPAHVRNALARIPQSNLPDSVKAKATAEAQRLLAAINRKKGDDMTTPANKTDDPKAAKPEGDKTPEPASKDGDPAADDKGAEGGKGADGKTDDKGTEGGGDGGDDAGGEGGDDAGSDGEGADEDVAKAVDAIAADIAKRGAKISSKRLAALRQMHATLTALLAEADGGDAGKSKTQKTDDGKTNDPPAADDKNKAPEGDGDGKGAPDINAAVEAAVNKAVSPLQDEIKTLRGTLTKQAERLRAAGYEPDGPSSQDGDDGAGQKSEDAVTWPRDMNDKPRPRSRRF